MQTNFDEFKKNAREVFFRGDLSELVAFFLRTYRTVLFEDRYDMLAKIYDDILRKDYRAKIDFGELVHEAIIEPLVVLFGKRADVDFFRRLFALYFRLGRDSIAGDSSLSGTFESCLGQFSATPRHIRASCFTALVEMHAADGKYHEPWLLLRLLPELELRGCDEQLDQFRKALSGLAQDAELAGWRRIAKIAVHQAGRPAKKRAAASEDDIFAHADTATLVEDWTGLYALSGVKG